MKTKAEIRAYYNEAYGKNFYGGKRSLSEQHGRGGSYSNIMKAYRPFTKDDIVLEIGCGEGVQMEGMCALVKEVHGVDISDVAIKNAHEFLKDCTNHVLYVDDNIEFFPDEHFDFIWEQTVFQHTLKTHVREYIDQSYRKLKVGGYVCFQFNDIHGLSERNELDMENMSSWTEEEFTGELIKLGFAIENVQRVELPTTAKIVVYYVIASKGRK